METKFAFYLDEFFKTVLIFFISLIFFRAFGLTFNLSLLFASIFTILLSILLYMLRTKNKDKQKMKLNDIKALNDIKEQFSFASENEIKNYFKSLLKANLNYKKELTIDNGEIVIKLCFDKELLQIEDIKKIYRENKGRKIKKVLILCYNYNEECKILTKNFKNIEYELMDLNKLYLTHIKQENNMPKFVFEKEPKEKLTLQRFKSIAFARNKSKTYFFCGLILLFSSYFVPLKTFYLIFSGLMFLSTLLCLIFNKKKI